MEHVRTACMIWKQVGILYLKNSKTFDPKTAGLQDEKDGSKNSIWHHSTSWRRKYWSCPGIPCQFNIHLALRSMASAKFLSHQSSPIHIPGARTSTANIQAPACAREPTANHWPGGVCRGLPEICHNFNRQNQLVCTWGSIWRNHLERIDLFFKKFLGLATIDSCNQVSRFCGCSFLFWHLSLRKIFVCQCLDGGVTAQDCPGSF